MAQSSLTLIRTAKGKLWHAQTDEGPFTLCGRRLTGHERKLIPLNKDGRPEFGDWTCQTCIDTWYSRRWAQR